MAAGIDDILLNGGVDDKRRVIVLSTMEDVG
jgi:hypothetical protein